MTPFREARSGGEPPAEVYMRSFGGGGGLRRIGFVLLAVLALVGVFSCATTVPTGHVAVLTRFGKVTGKVLHEGLNFKNPLDKSNEINIRTQELKETASVPSNEGLIMTLDASLIFRLREDAAAEVFRTLGPGYISTIVEPTLRSTIRSVTSAHTANALYTSARDAVGLEVFNEMVKQMAPRGIQVEKLLLRDVQLPPTLKASIEAKQRAEQEALQMSFVLQKEKQEAERKRIEGQGIADFQRIVAQGISQQLLTWKGIEATEKLANSANAKVIMIGSPRTGLPLIMEPK
jgi:regulator of protease activity HflC (stomatin/prohibitin superfamily)